MFQMSACAACLELSIHLWRPKDGILDNEVDELENVVGVVRWLTHNQLVEDTPKRPEVSPVVIRPGRKTRKRKIMSRRSATAAASC